jgi:hypothetical protein
MSASPTPDSDGFFSRLVRIDDPDLAIRRVRRNALVVLAVMTVATGLVTGAVWKVAGVLVSGALMLLNFNALVAAADVFLGSATPSTRPSPRASPGPLQMAFLAGRHVLLGIVLCAIVLLPGVGVIPVALGLSVLVLAILPEAILQVSAGPQRRP